MDDRIQDKTIIIKCGYGQQKTTRILHLFTAEQFRSRCRPGKRNANPTPPAHDRKWWRTHYRLRLDDRWYNPGPEKYRFYDTQEICKIIADLITTDNGDDNAPKHELCPDHHAV